MAVMNHPKGLENGQESRKSKEVSKRKLSDSPVRSEWSVSPIRKLVVYSSFPKILGNHKNT